VNITLNKNDEIVMKLIHYFITEQGYNPIVLHGAKDEIWLENSDNDEYQIVRIVTNYIHNDEQFDFDLYRTQQIMKRIQKKTFSIKMSALSIFVNLGDNVHIEEIDIDNIDCIELKEINDIKNYEFITENFPTIDKIDRVSEKGLELFMKLTEEINQKNQEDAEKAEDVFSKKRPIITYALLISNFILFLTMIMSGANMLSLPATTLYEFGGLTNYETMGNLSELYRLVVSIFLHGGIIHLIFNMYALYIIGPQIESFFGKTKYLIIYLGSGIIGNLLSMLFQVNGEISIGASGAIFGLLGALVYFGYHYRVYLGSVIKSQIIPLIIINFVIMFMMPGINIAAHFGGLLGGFILTKAVGVKYKSTRFDQINGIIMTAIIIIFLCYMNFIV
jgi:rhomboid protease GluP